MNRRKFIWGTMGFAGFSGCSGGPLGSDVTPSETTTPTQTLSPSPTATPKPAAFDVTVDAPSEVSVERDYSVKVEVTNTGDKEGTFRSSIVMTWQDEVGSNTVGGVILSVQPGETRAETVAIDGLSRGGTAEFQLTEADIQWEMEVTTDAATPEVLFVNLVSEWNSFGDAEVKAIQSDTVGEIIVVAFRHRTFVHDGTYHTTSQLIIYDNNTNEQMFVDKYKSDRLTDTAGYAEWETAMSADTRGWGPGEYIAEVTIRDEVNGQVSKPETVKFELVGS